MPAPEGNKNNTKNKPWADALRRAMARYGDGKKNALNLIAEQTVELAVNGEMWAIKEIGDRTDGKAAQSVTVGGDPDAPMVTKIVREIVRPANPDS